MVPTIEQIAEAAARMDPVFAHSPLLRGTPLDGGGAEVVLKVETLNPVRSFKGRGAVTWMRHVGPNTPGVVCASVGNFGQGLAYAARQAGKTCAVFVGAAANPVKLDAIRGFGADVHAVDGGYEKAIEAARTFAEETGQRFVQDGHDQLIAAGAGTIAHELTEAGVRPDVALVPVGNSALILGIAVWLRQVNPDTRIVGVCAEQAPAPALSWREGRVVTAPSDGTAADGIAVAEPFAESVTAMREWVDDMVLVSEDALSDATRRIAEELSLLVEPAGAAGVAALLTEPERYAGARVFTPLCGGHLHPGTLRWA